MSIHHSDHQSYRSFGIPRTDTENGNYLWIQNFHSALNKRSRVGFFMAISPINLNEGWDAKVDKKSLQIALEWCN